ncbi:hypothetical protein ACQUE8_11590 [Enterococcus casseliflavus]|uniref:hypothetical protein n=1 Tax=Enterococcus casseliflavus TaxID=37734 RepID=UPI003D0BF88A
MSKFNIDEISVSNTKIILTLVTSVALVINAFTSNNLYSLFFTAVSHCTSNALAFYVVDPKSDSGNNRKARIINIYIITGAILLVLLLIHSNFKNEIAKNILFWIFKLLVMGVSFVAPSYAIKDDDDLESSEIKKTKHRVQKIKETNAKEKKFANRNKNVKMNQDTKEFIESTDNKDTREGRRR